MHVLYICISVFKNYDCTIHPILLFITLLQSLFRNIPPKEHLIHRWWTVISFSSVDCKQRVKNFTLIYHLIFPMGRCMTFQGRCKKSLGHAHHAIQYLKYHAYHTISYHIIPHVVDFNRGYILSPNNPWGPWAKRCTSPKYTVFFHLPQHFHQNPALMVSNWMLGWPWI
jgi:hypothetical protein